MGGNLTFNDNDDVQLKGATDSTLIGNVADSLKVTTTSSALPTGAATAANQATEISSLSTISTNTSNTNTSVQNTQGTVAAGTAATKSDLIGGVFNTSLPTLTNSQQVALQLDSSGRVIIRPLTSADIISAAQSGTWTTGRTWTLASGTDSVSSVQSGTWNITNISGTISLPTGASTSALQTTGNTSLSSIDGKFNSLGQKTMAASAPVVLASDQSAIPVTQSGTWNLNNISGTISLPTGAATSANQTTEITALQLIDNPIGTVAAGTAGTSSFLAGIVFNTALPTLTNGQQVALQGDSSGRQIIAPLTNTSVVKAQLQDNAGNALSSNNSQLQVRDVINTAGQFRSQSITTTAAEALGGATILANRKFLSITPTNGTVYWGTANTVTTSTGTPIFKNQTVTLAFTDNVHVYVIAGSTTDSRMVEGS